ncbi:hypothetical protein BU15DRAFT_57918 [Melanogaster broomeanus]|nr:hypothetical protein BU15DRAFT_57918 [Melanogaster broomeanus]
MSEYDITVNALDTSPPSDAMWGTVNRITSFTFTSHDSARRRALIVRHCHKWPLYHTSRAYIRQQANLEPRRNLAHWEWRIFEAATCNLSNSLNSVEPSTENEVKCDVPPASFTTQYCDDVPRPIWSHSSVPRVHGVLGRSHMFFAISAWSVMDGHCYSILKGIELVHYHQYFHKDRGLDEGQIKVFDYTRSLVVDLHDGKVPRWNHPDFGMHSCLPVLHGDERRKPAGRVLVLERQCAVLSDLKLELELPAIAVEPHRHWTVDGVPSLRDSRDAQVATCLRKTQDSKPHEVAGGLLFHAKLELFLVASQAFETVLIPVSPVHCIREAETLFVLFISRIGVITAHWGQENSSPYSLGSPMLQPGSTSRGYRIGVAAWG